MKKMKFTFWLLGFGCGIVFTGIIGTFAALKVQNSVTQEINDPIQSKKDNESDQVVGQLPSGSPSEESIEMPKVSVIESQESEEKQNQQVSKDMITPQSSIEAENQDVKDKIVEEDTEALVYKEIDIPKTAGASEICQLLEEEGMIENADDFLAYIEANNKQRLLKHGHLSLPQDADFERLLEELTF